MTPKDRLANHHEEIYADQKLAAVEVRERIWRDAQHAYVRPLPGRLGVTSRSRSRRLQRVLTDFGCEHSLTRAQSVREHYGFDIGANGGANGDVAASAQG